MESLNRVWIESESSLHWNSKADADLHSSLFYECKIDINLTLKVFKYKNRSTVFEGGCCDASYLHFSEMIFSFTTNWRERERERERERVDRASCCRSICIESFELMNKLELLRIDSWLKVTDRDREADMLIKWKEDKKFQIAKRQFVWDHLVSESHNKSDDSLWFSLALL